MKKFLILVMLVLLSSCSGQQNGTCIPNTNPSTDAATGRYQNRPAEIFEYIKNAKIITTIINQIKVTTIGADAASSSGNPASWNPVTIVKNTLSSLWSSITGQPSANGPAAQNMFTALTSNDAFKSAMRAAFSLAIVLYGVGIATGIVQAQLGDALVRVGKILVVAFVASNWATFYEIAGKFFMGLTDELIYYLLNAFGDLYGAGPASTSAASNGLFSTITNVLNIVSPGSGFGHGQVTTETLFADVDLFFAQIFSMHTFAIMAALMSESGQNSGPYSNVYGLLLIFSLFQLASAILRVVTIYAFSLFAKAFLFAIAPIFFMFLLFNPTKSLFDAWVKQLISVSLQPVFIMSMVGLFIAVISPLFKELYAMRVCFQDLHWVFEDGNGVRYQASVSNPPPIKLESVLMLFFYSWLFQSFVQFAEGFARAIVQASLGNFGDLATNTFKSIGFGK